MSDSRNFLGKEKISKLLFHFAIPSIVGMVINGLYNIVDRIFVGQAVGDLGIAGITIAMPIMTIGMAFGMLIGFGGGSLLSIFLGEKKQEQAEYTLGNVISLFLIVSLVITVVGILFIEPLLSLMGASEEVMPYSLKYTRIIVWGYIFQSIGFGLNSLIRSEGNPTRSMTTQIVGAITNIVLDYLFIIVLGMGIEGAAIATVIAWFISSMLVLHFFLSKKSVLKLAPKYFLIKPDIIKKIVSIGFASFAVQISIVFVMVIVNHSLGFYGGDIAISVFGVIGSIQMTILMPVFGLNHGAQPIIGYNYGARNYDRVKETLKLSVICGTVITTLGFLMIELAPELLIGFFNREGGNLVNHGVFALRIYLSMLPIVAIQIICANFFVYIGQSHKAILLSLTRQVILLIPALLILPLFFGLNGIWFAAPVADVLSFIWTLIVITFELKKLGQSHLTNVQVEVLPDNVV